MIEVELKSVVDDVARRRALVEQAGGTLAFEGQLEDRRYDTITRTLSAQDHVLRVRIYRAGESTKAELDWKGPTRLENGYKLREEIGSEVSDANALVAMLERLGYEVTVAIERDIAQYTLFGATVRFERYPRLDDLVEVEGEPAQIERAIAALALPREGFTAERLPDFVRRYEARTGQRAALSQAELAGDVRWDVRNA